MALTVKTCSLMADAFGNNAAATEIANAIAGADAVGDISVSGSVTGGTGLVATTGGVLATAGDVTATAGNFVATVGTVSATVGGIQTSQAVTNVHDTEPTQAEMVTAFGAAARGLIRTIDDNDGDAISYLCWATDASWYYLKGNKGG